MRQKAASSLTLQQCHIPWKIPGEQKIFRRLTEGKVVVMGRKTFESIGKPLPNRHTLV
ncbi:dihydrofolate reductase, partial [Klebsiella pneumoniae]|uniref:dihydrofolate reductase n=1 Tax=Klebsiella pneumoniae TaxID=573 RepID=UPI001144BA49